MTPTTPRYGPPVLPINGSPWSRPPSDAFPVVPLLALPAGPMITSRPSTPTPLTLLVCWSPSSPWPNKGPSLGVASSLPAPSSPSPNLRPASVPSPLATRGCASSPACSSASTLVWLPITIPQSPATQSSTTSPSTNTASTLPVASRWSSTKSVSWLPPAPRPSLCWTSTTATPSTRSSVLPLPTLSLSSLPIGYPSSPGPTRTPLTCSVN